MDPRVPAEVDPLDADLGDPPRRRLAHERQDAAMVVRVRVQVEEVAPGRGR